MNKQLVKQTWALLLFIAFASVQCSQNQKEESKQIVETNLKTLVGDWKLEGIYRSQTQQLEGPPSGLEVNLKIDSVSLDNQANGTIKFNGKGPINHFFGKWNVENGQIQKGEKPVGATEMAGPPEAMNYEGDLFNLFINFDEIKIEGEKTTLKNQTSGDYLLFQKAEGK
ncbi:META domain-containing protein [Rapidithrix thailandica]|uniref:META domain-containing protein n=1 Tax=Rapidithrix thailandica TaxID=413964 RepID=A0AAW9S3X7_9BACT